MGRVKKHHLDFFELLSGLYLLLMLLLVLVIASSGDFKIFYVLVGFSPVILTVIISLMLHENFAKHKAGLWLIPLAINIAFYFFGTTTPTFFAQFDIDLLTGVNFILSIIYVLIVFTVFIKDIEIKVAKKEAAARPIEKKSLQEYIHSIEDKSKALNFAIGRVYNKYHGGTDDLRNKLRIPADWYNEFSLIGVGTNKINYEQLHDLITRFELQLKNFEKTEFELFKDKANSLKNLIRDVKGTDKVIDVLDHNDKDPVLSYYKGAVEFCQKVKEEIKDKNLKIVKNKYIPKDEDELAEITGKQKVHDKTSLSAQQSPKPEINKESTSNNAPKKISNLPPIKKSTAKPPKKKVEFNRRPPNLHP